MRRAVLVLALALAGCGGSGEPDPAPRDDVPRLAAARPASVAAGTVGGRRYTLHDPGGRAPLATYLAFHGRWSDARDLRRVTRLDRRAGDAAVVYLHGVRQGWGDAPRPTPARPDPQADVRFAERVVARLVRRGIADPERVYAIGFSNGAGMALRLAAERPRLLAGVGAVAGQLPAGVRVRGPVPAYVIHGALDPLRPAGGLPDPPPGEDGPTASVSAGGTVRAFGAAFPGAREVEPGVWRAGGRTVARLWIVADGGHTWPGADPAAAPDGVGPTSRSVDATGLLLEHLR